MNDEEWINLGYFNTFGDSSNMQLHFSNSVLMHNSCCIKFLFFSAA